MKSFSTDRQINGFAFVEVRRTAFILAAASLLLCISTAAAEAQMTFGGGAKQQKPTPAEWEAVANAIGKSGSMQPGDVFKIGLPRTDLEVTVRGVQLNPVLALGSWVAFKKSSNMTMVMGDLVLTEAEVGPVMWSLQESGIDMTALHNHVLDESPRVMYMHISGHGEALKLAEALHRALSYTKTPLETPGKATLKTRSPARIELHQLEIVLNRTGKENSGVYQFSIPRAEKIMENETEIPPAME